MIDVRCPRCGNTHLADNIHAGKFLRCAKCGAPVQIGSKPDSEVTILNGPTVTPAPKKRHAHRLRTSRLSRKQLGGITAGLVVLASVGIAYSRFQQADIFDRVSEPGGAQASATRPQHPSTANAQPPAASPVLLDDSEYDDQTHRTGETMTTESRARGRGKLVLINGATEDGVILLLDRDTEEIERSIYVRAGETGTIERLAPGNYLVRGTTGTDWSEADRAFRDNPNYFVFSHPYRFTEEDVSKGVEFSKWTLTLHEVPNGNVSKQPITRDEFWRSTPNAN